MGRTPDRIPGASDEEATIYEDTSAATQAGEVRYGSGAFSLFDAVGEFDPRLVWQTPHRSIRHLIHFIDSGPGFGFASGAHHEILPIGDPFPTSYIWWESAAKTQKIVELTVTRNSNKTPSVEVWEMYDTDGSTVLETVSDAISYSGVIETTRTRTIS